MSTAEKQFALNQVVLIVDLQLLRALWPVGEVADTHTRSDGHVRTAAIKERDKTYIRPFT